MGYNTNSSFEMNLSDTARIDRRNIIFAQIEAALLSDQLKLEASGKTTGGDPYDTGNSVVSEPAIWKGRPR
jgi:hypothetical protein